ncbi:nucleotidyltransferase substrate binding protein [Geomonas sp. Red32]|uniref:nucleotidyltransferase substrate binding protein n=1 Tax=Geomonas sp. Red32 TaxID=2912856 RepID=UPI00202CD08F|nr:nucleotidyltransferase substrate binding protein [Geomonas sp. Red32]MCM0082991.1 nucleotidyltransferase substrate binding protein [Geomonas sp. Red32]
MTDQDIRWQQRFAQFEKAYLLLQQAIEIETPSIIERAGLVQFYERSFEHACELLKDHARVQGLTVVSPRVAIKEACRSGLLTAPRQWEIALQKQTQTRMVYEEKIAVEVEGQISDLYLPLLEELHSTFSKKLFEKAEVLQ